MEALVEMFWLVVSDVFQQKLSYFPKVRSKSVSVLSFAQRGISQSFRLELERDWRVVWVRLL